MTDYDARSNPVVAAWADELEPPGDAALYLQVRVGVPGVLALAQVAMPRLIEVDGIILVADRYREDTFRQWQERLGDDRQALARAINNFVVYDELDALGESSDESEAQAAEFVAACWRARAAEQFPDRPVVVEVVEQYGPTVVMYERA